MAATGRGIAVDEEGANSAPGESVRRVRAITGT